jgi:sodium transport system ATP-binding protein
MIEVTNLHKRFGAVTAVEDVSFRAEDGVVTGLLGPNGAGKTTTLRMLYTLVRPDRGSVKVDGLEVHGLSGATLDKRIDELVELLDMKDIAHRRTEGFSQGERMKVALARALVHGPRNVLLDEPTNGLDVMSTRAVRTLIRRLREQGHCVVFSSHVMQEVAALCDRIVVVARGRVVAEGTPDELRARTGKDSLEEAFVTVIGSDQGLMQ